MKKTEINITELRHKVSQGALWKSLDEVAQTTEFKQHQDNEHPFGAQQDNNGLSRRDFLKVMGASLLMTSLTGCKQPLEKIVPYVSQPEEIIPGKPLYFASSIQFNGHSTGVLVESHMGRPTKIEGNPEHPDSLGGTNAIHQATLLGLYDPDRSKQILNNNNPASWNDFKTFTNKLLAESDGENIRLLTDRVISPTLYAQIQEFISKHPKAKWHQYDAVNVDESRHAQIETFGSFVDPIYDLNKAKVVVAFDANFMSNIPGALRYAKQFTKHRNIADGDKNLNRLYVIGSTPSNIQSLADHTLNVETSKIHNIIIAIAHTLGITTTSSHLSHEEEKFVQALIDDLKHHQGDSLLIAGNHLPRETQTLIYAINQKLGNAGKTVNYIKPIESEAVVNQDSLNELVNAINNKEVESLFIFNTNPAYAAPSGLDFVKAVRKVKNLVHYGLYLDETSELANWHVPATHFLEHFSDGKASDGTLTTVQPLIEPLYKTKSIHEVFDVLNSHEERNGLSIVQDYWKKILGENNFTNTWRKALHDGFVKNTTSSFLNVSAKTSLSSQEKSNKGYEIVILPDPHVWDGAFSNNAWLQELPKPFSKLTWDNALYVSPKAAEHFHLQNGDMVSVKSGAQSIELPIWIVPGQAEHTLTTFLGYGRKFGSVADQKGFNVYPLFQNTAIPNVSLTKIGQNYKLVSTQIHHSMHGRNLARSASLEEYKHHPDFAKGHHHGPPGFKDPALFHPHPKKAKHAWGMTIDLNKCIGCNACITACQSENNIPTVGKHEVSRGREMFWMRIDQYYAGDLDHPEVHNQPVTCMHCENAPCEPVCPVGATGHSNEGINEMTYNRCVGTRYCSNNCPYKVRRFNFFQFADKKTKTYQLMYNPDVTVRNRGVMEKCTFCVQRINHARIAAEKENRLIRDGEVITACQQVCPTGAINFGNIKDPNSEVSKKKSSKLNYGMLTEINTNPRVSYLAKVKNTNTHLSKNDKHKSSGAHH